MRNRETTMTLRIILIVTALTLTLSACNTMEGLGKDVSNAGESLSDGAQKTKQKINESK
jgi:predicted small secreted protein